LTRKDTARRLRCNNLSHFPGYSIGDILHLTLISLQVFRILSGKGLPNWFTYINKVFDDTVGQMAKNAQA
jgi:hypothetical protein